ncbi:MAG TPA: Eco57I restriction-modification methylase domain-containing protein, partial [Verrucomicrobiae bacterium]|nr:Eco57I restriction-modification methylase domain-containing protein [Verrucomicrobiae bacterium]
MNLELARKTIAETFRQKFDDGKFLEFIRNLLNPQSVTFDETGDRKKTWTLKKAAFEDYVNHFTRLGTYRDPGGEKVDVLVIYLRKNTTLSRGRVTLRNFVADYLANGHGQGKAAVMAAFVAPDEDDWRFSFVKLDFTFEKSELGFVNEKRELTPARRYSYLVGKNENCHTAQKQFLALLTTEEANPSVAQLEAAFSIEKVAKEFFEHYRELFEHTRDALTAVLETTPRLKRHFDERGIVCDDFAKKLLGQIVFLYFLQKKGWFGVERGELWGSGHKGFIRHLFKEREHYAHLIARKLKRPPNFFNDILEPLFYDAISRPRLEEDHYYSQFDCKIPFLNGGLFEPLYGYKWDETEILLPDTLFANTEPTGEENEKGTGILDVFDRYNFTVNESEPLEKEVAVDPEMLGKVFENLLSENIRHGSGTYYTPRVIVHYMCQQALLHYLIARAAQVPPADLALFLRLAERFADFEAKDKKSYAEKGFVLPETISQNAASLDDLLAIITVCDPAIGSGAFPVGMMHEIVRARIALTGALEKQNDPRAKKPRTAYALKRDCIQHSLYGVDLDPGAVEIAKLRLWLSMVVDEDQIRDIQPLPNLDYKIMQGNSLLEEFNSVRLLDDKLLQPPAASCEAEIAETKARINALSQEFFKYHEAGKKGAAQKLATEQEIRKLKKRLGALVNPAAAGDDTQGELNQQTSWANLKRIQELHDQFFGQNSRGEKEKLRCELDALEWSFMEATLREQGHTEAIADLKRASATHRKPFFLWRLHFGEVFQQRGGFDVVIGNPPYIQLQNDQGALANKYQDSGFETFARMGDIYTLFYERGRQLLRDGGHLCYITSNKWMRAGYGEKLRAFLATKTQPKILIDFAGQKIFESATVDTNILLFERKADIPTHSTLACIATERCRENLSVFVRQHA